MRTPSGLLGCRCASRRRLQKIIQLMQALILSQREFRPVACLPFPGARAVGNLPYSITREWFRRAPPSRRSSAKSWWPWSWASACSALLQATCNTSQESWKTEDPHLSGWLRQGEVQSLGLHLEPCLRGRTGTSWLNLPYQRCGGFISALKANPWCQTAQLTGPALPHATGVIL